jgi:hypothetical protein
LLGLVASRVGIGRIAHQVGYCGTKLRLGTKMRWVRHGISNRSGLESNPLLIAE